MELNGNNKADKGGYTGLDKASILLMSLDEEVASKIFSMMTEDEIRQISQAMSTVGKVEPTTLDDLMTEFTEDISSGKTVVGDINNAKKLLSKALGADKVESILGDIAGPTGKDTWDRLNNVNEELLSAFLKNEHPQTVALVLSKMRPSRSAAVLTLLPEEFSINIIYRLINIEPVKREIVSDVEKVLQAEFMSSLSQGKTTDSYETVAEIFNNFDRQTEQAFFDKLEGKNAETAQKVRDLMFTFDDLAKLEDPAIQVVIRNADKQKLPIALKGANDTIKDLFYKNMSERAAKILQEDIQSLGPVRLKDVDEAQMNIVQTAKTLADKGEIQIPDGEDEQEQMIY